MSLVMMTGFNDLRKQSIDGGEFLGEEDDTVKNQRIGVGGNNVNSRLLVPRGCANYYDCGVPNRHFVLLCCVLILTSVKVFQFFR